MTEVENTVAQHDVSIQIIKNELSHMIKGIDEIKDLLKNGYVTKEQLESFKLSVDKDILDLRTRINDKVVADQKFYNMIRNIIVTALTLGILALLGLKSF